MVTTSIAHGGRKGAMMAYELTVRPTRYVDRWEALHLGVIPTTITVRDTREAVVRTLTRMVEVGMLPQDTTWE